MRPSSDVLTADQRERLFEATVNLIAKRGYRGTSVDQIVTAAGIDHRAFYALYASKEECFLAAFDRIVAEATAAVAAAVADLSEWPRQMATALACLLDLIVAEPQRARIALVEVQAAGPGAYSHYEKIVDDAAPKLREGRVFSPGTAVLSDALEQAVLGGVIWIVQQRLVKGELKEADRMIEEASQVMLSPYVGETEAKRVARSTVSDRPRPK